MIHYNDHCSRFPHIVTISAYSIPLCCYLAGWDSESLRVLQKNEYYSQGKSERNVTEEEFREGSGDLTVQRQGK